MKEKKLIVLNKNLKLFFASKNIIKNVKGQSTEWEKIFVNHVSHIVNTQNKELLQLYNKNKQPNLKMNKGIEKNTNQNHNTITSHPVGWL